MILPASSSVSYQRAPQSLPVIQSFTQLNRKQQQHIFMSPADIKSEHSVIETIIDAPKSVSFIVP